MDSVMQYLINGLVFAIGTLLAVSAFFVRGWMADVRESISGINKQMEAIKNASSTDIANLRDRIHGAEGLRLTLEGLKSEIKELRSADTAVASDLKKMELTFVRDSVSKSDFTETSREIFTLLNDISAKLSNKVDRVECTGCRGERAHTII